MANLWSNLEDQISGCSENNNCNKETKLPVLIPLQFAFSDWIGTKSVVNPSFAIQALLNTWMVTRWVGRHSFLQKAFRWVCGWCVSRAGVITLLWLWWWAVSTLGLQYTLTYCMKASGCSEEVKGNFLSDLSKNTVKSFNRLVSSTACHCVPKKPKTSGLFSASRRIFLWPFAKAI